MTEKQIPSLIKPILLIILSSLLYIAFIRPARLIVNQKIYHPVISSIFSNYTVELPPNNSAAIVVNQKSEDKKLWISFPFGGFYIIPFVLLAIQRNWKLANQFTLYHIIISLLPFLFLLPIIKILLPYLPSGLFQQLSIVLGLVFTILAVKEYYLKDYEQS